MKKGHFKFTISALAVIMLAALPMSHLASQSFQRIYGTSLNNYFTKVIKDGINYYVLGQDEPVQGSPLHATVTRLDANGMHQWTLSLNIPSLWNDAILTPSGDLLVVGATLPFDASNKSLMGLVTSSGGGNFTWIRTYNVIGREANSKIIKSPNPENSAFPYYVLGNQFDANGGPLWDDIFLMNIDENGIFNWKKLFPSIADDEFSHDLEVLPNGDLILSGNIGTNGVILQVNNTGALISGLSPEGVSFSFYDVASESGGGYYAIGAVFPSFTAHLMKYDHDLINLWDFTISGLTSVSQVWEGPLGGDIYVTGRGVFNGLSREVILLFNEVANVPVLQWVKFLDNGETSYTGGATTFLSANQIAFADGRFPSSGGFGQNCAFMSVSDFDLLTCMTKEDFVNVGSSSFLYFSPIVPAFELFDFSTGTDVTSAALSWQQEAACSMPCQADFIISPIGPCGHYQVTNTSTGVQPLTYLWCNGSSLENLDVTLPCGPQTFCLTITDATGCISSYIETITVTDNTPPIAVCALPFGVVLDTSCQYIVTPQLIDAGSSDNCQIQSLSVSPAVLIGCGVFPVTLTVFDWCGNSSSCTTMIQTIEDVPPFISCPANKILTTTSPSCTMVVNGLQWTLLSDNCSTPSVTYTVAGASSYSGTGDASGLLFNAGVSTITYTALDDCGNTAECSFTITLACTCNCVNNLIQNPGFFEGAVAGHYGLGGHSDHWEIGTNSNLPEVTAIDSCCDSYSIQMVGSNLHGSTILQQGLNFQMGHHYKISFCGRLRPSNTLATNVSFVFTASNNKFDNLYNCSACENIGSIICSDINWNSYTLPIWTPYQNETVLFIRAHQMFGSIAWGRIDNICVQEVNQSCCTDKATFIENAANSVNIYADASGEEGIFDIGNLPECDSVEIIDWGDGNRIEGLIGKNSMRRNRFLDHLLARVKYKVIEYNQDVEPAVPCFEQVFIDSLLIGGLDTCVCNSFSELYMQSSLGHFRQVIDYFDTPVLLPCVESGSGYVLTGLFSCSGHACTDTWPFTWMLTGPGGTNSGSEIANPYFGIHFLPTYFTTPGIYTLTLGGQCANNNCSSVIQFNVDCPDPCPCTAQDIEDFHNRIDRSFARVMRPDYGCNVYFSPLELNDCESVTWYLDNTSGTPIGESEGRQLFNYVFPEAGTYSVIMEVTKKKADGSTCDKQMRSQQVTVTCLPPPDCIDAIIDNPGFSEGVIAGGLNSGGQSTGWNTISGEPEVIEGEPGSSDGWSILLSGNADTADILTRTEPICLERRPHLLKGTSVKSSKSNHDNRSFPTTLKVFLGRGWTFPPVGFKINECDGINCFEIGSVILPNTDSAEWFEIQIPFDLSDWDVVDSCGGVLVRPIIYVTNPFSNNQGGEATFSYAQLDNFCLNNALVGLHDPSTQQNIRIYPNPNSGEFILELNEPASEKMLMHITNLAGQIVMEKKLEVGIELQKIDAAQLYQGMYFMQIISDGRVMSVDKFVIQ